MAPTVNDVAEKTQMLEIDPKSGVAMKTTKKDASNGKEPESNNNEQEKEKLEAEAETKEEKVEQEKPTEEAAKEEEVPVEVEPKTGVSFPVRLADGKKLDAVGLRKKSMLGIGIKIYGFGTFRYVSTDSRIMGEASDDIPLTPGSVIEISRLPGYTLQTKVKDEIVSSVESELLCRAFIHMYLGEDPFDKEAKEKFGTSLLSLF